MYGVMMKSQLTSGETRTVAVVPTDDGVRIFSRLGDGRGKAGAWEEGDTPINSDEKVIGEPVSIKITPAEQKLINLPVSPSMFLWKLGKEVTATNVTELSTFTKYHELIDAALNNPSSLDVYTQAINKVVAPTPQPVVTQQVAIPLPAQPIMSEETPMEYAQPVAPSNDSYAVLTIPEVKKHFVRTFDGHTEVEIFNVAKAQQQTVCITGPAGTGKTSAAYNYAATNGLPFVVIEGTRQIDETKVHGRFIPTGVGQSVKWKYSQFATAIQQESVILINELSRMPGKAADLFLRVLNERELIIDQLNEVIKVNPKCLFIVDQNTGVGYHVTNQDKALMDRMQPKLEFDYDISIERKFIPSEALLQFANSIREASKMSDQFTTPMSPRILLNFISNAKHLSLGFAVTSLLNNFPNEDGEREAIKMRLDADIETIAQELNVPLGSYSA